MDSVIQYCLGFLSVGIILQIFNHWLKSISRNNQELPMQYMKEAIKLTAELRDLIEPAGIKLPDFDFIEPLTAAEKPVALYMIDGYSYKKIADSIFIDVRTVETHAMNIMRKANCKTKSEFAAKANRTSLRDQLKGTRL
jgi:DNA-binding CsgD family transcriptional regulator